LPIYSFGIPWLQPVTPGNEYSLFAPLSVNHHDELCGAARDGELRSLWYTSIPSLCGMKAEIDRRLVSQARMVMLPFPPGQ
jgi:hypothetical protein